MRNFFCILFTISTLCFSCGEKLSDENSITSQKENIEAFINSSSFDFVEINGLYRARTSTTPDTATVKVERGDLVSVNYVINTFSRSIGAFVYTNDEAVAVEQGAFSTAQDYTPIKFECGKYDVLKAISKAVEGTAVNNEYFVLATSDEGYGNSGIGMVPKGSSLAVTIKIVNIEKNE